MEESHEKYRFLLVNYISGVFQKLLLVLRGSESSDNGILEGFYVDKNLIGGCVRDGNAAAARCLRFNIL